MSVFSDAWQAAMPALDRTFARPLMIVPRVTGDYVRTNGVPFLRVGILDTRPLALRQAGSGADKADQSDRISAKCTIDFDARVFLAPEEVPQEGWRISTVPTIAEPIPAEYEVTWRDPDGQGRINLHVVPV